MVRKAANGTGELEDLLAWISIHGGNYLHQEKSITDKKKKKSAQDRKYFEPLIKNSLLPVNSHNNDIHPAGIGRSEGSWKSSCVCWSACRGSSCNTYIERTIALTSAVAKVFETLLNSHFIKHLESNNLLSDHQYGFRKARSTGDLLSHLTHAWSSSLRNFGESLIVALDISKAFDRVWLKALLARLPAYGFTSSFCKLISSFLSNCFISVAVDGATSASFLISSSVPQGSVLSPTPFLLFINYLLHASASDVHSFADDSTLHKSSSLQCQPSSNACSQSSTINSDLQSISKLNLAKFNISKMQLLTIYLSNTSSNYLIIFEDREIQPLNSINILVSDLKHPLACLGETILSKLRSQPLKKIGGSFLV